MRHSNSCHHNDPSSSRNTSPVTDSFESACDGDNAVLSYGRFFRDATAFQLRRRRSTDVAEPHSPPHAGSSTQMARPARPERNRTATSLGDSITSSVNRRDGVDGPRRHRVCQSEFVAYLTRRGPSMEQISRIGMDTSKRFFQLHGVNAAETVILRKKLRRKGDGRVFREACANGS
jgi:hypothetical protein